MFEHEQNVQPYCNCYVYPNRGDAQTKTGKSTNTKGAYQRKVVELKKKIKQTNSDANDCDKDIGSLQENQQQVSTQLEDKQSKVYQLQSSVDEGDLNIDRLTDERKRVSVFNFIIQSVLNCSP
jgi:septal ring factor EnvC (AmiA/AmiB activator)